MVRRGIHPDLHVTDGHSGHLKQLWKSDHPSFANELRNYCMLYKFKCGCIYILVLNLTILCQDVKSFLALGGRIESWRPFWRIEERTSTFPHHISWRSWKLTQGQAGWAWIQVGKREKILHSSGYVRLGWAWLWAKLYKDFDKLFLS